MPEMRSCLKAGMNLLSICRGDKPRQVGLL
jgi:hypothetical protein